MNFARVVSLPFTWSGSGRCGGKRPSTATPRMVFAEVFSKMQALRAPVHRIEAWTIRWCSSWRREPLAEGLGHQVHEVEGPLAVLDRRLPLLLPLVRLARTR
jgi:hypothetical protein